MRQDTSAPARGQAGQSAENSHAAHPSSLAFADRPPGRKDTSAHASGATKGAANGHHAHANHRSEKGVVTAIALHKQGYWSHLVRPNARDWFPGQTVVDEKGVEKEVKSQKRPIGNGWGLERWTEDRIRRTAEKFPGAGVGIAFGPGRAPGGGWLIDLEIDGPEGVDSRASVLGGEELDTPSWDSTRGGHAVLVADGDRLLDLLEKCGAEQGKGIKAGVWHLPDLPGLEWRIGGLKPDGTVKQVHSVVPPTVGDDGKPRAWKVSPRTPVARLPESAYTLLAEIAERKAAERRPEPAKVAAPAAQPAPRGSGGMSVEERAAKYLDKCDPAISGKRGHNKTFGVACKVGPGFDLPPDVAFRLLMDRYNPRCEPEWSEAEIRHKVEDAYEEETRRGWLRDAPLKNGRHDGNGRVPVANGDGNRRIPGDVGDGSTGTPEVNEAVDDPHRLARLYLDASCRHPDGLTLRYYQGEFLRWDGSAYRAEQPKEVNARLARACKAEFDRANLAAIAKWEKNGQADDNGKPCPKPTAKKVGTRLIGDVSGALASESLLEGSYRPPSWIGEDVPDFDPADVIPCRNALVCLPALVAGRDAIKKPTPRFFGTYAVDYDFRLDAPEPTEWLRFLGSLWPKDPGSIAMLQEWFGYCLTPDTSQQKILVPIGPKRCGKGTIARVLRAMIGPENVAGPTLNSLTTNFGLAPLIGKPLAIISDARLSSRSDQAVMVERLLAISGEDTVDIDRKHREPLTGCKLPTRFVLISNELPRLSDASGALVGRMIILRIVPSFYGKEDPSLLGRLLPELPGILLWAIKGWERLRERGYFVQPESGNDLVQQMEESSSPIGVFVRDRCELGHEFEVNTSTLYDAWKEWCESVGRKEGDKSNFGRNLHTVVPGLTTPKTREGESQVRRYRGIRLKRGDS